MNRKFSWVKGIKKRSTSRAAGRSRRGTSLQLERLEDRRVLSMTAYYDDGHRDGDDNWGFADLADLSATYDPNLVGIHIIGTPQKDKVEVSETGGLMTFRLTESGGTKRTFYSHTALTPNIYFHGLGGDDTFTSTSAATTYAWGGEGMDDLNGGWGEVHLWGEGGDDTLHAGNLAYGEFHGGSGSDTLLGTQLQNSMWGDEGVDFIYGRGGDDYLVGGDNDDFIYGGNGNDTIIGSDGNDSLYGQNGDDDIAGGDGDDVLDGGAGVDWLYGGDSSDHLHGGSDDDYDYMDGERGADVYHRSFIGWAGVDYTGDYFANFQPSEGDSISHSDVDNYVLELLTPQFKAGKGGGSKSAYSADAPADELLFDEPILEVPSWSEAQINELNANILAGLGQDSAPGIADGDDAGDDPLTEVEDLDANLGLFDDETDDGVGNYDDVDNFFAQAAEEAEGARVDEEFDDDYETTVSIDDAFESDWNPNAISDNGLKGWSAFAG